MKVVGCHMYVICNVVHHHMIGSMLRNYPIVPNYHPHGWEEEDEWEVGILLDIYQYCMILFLCRFQNIFVHHMKVVGCHMYVICNVVHHHMIGSMLRNYPIVPNYHPHVGCA